MATTLSVQTITAGITSLATGTGVVASGAGLVSGFIASNPVGWAIGAGLVVGVAYNSNFLGIKDITNHMGDNLEDGIEDVGRALKSGWKNIQSVFGW